MVQLLKIGCCCHLAVMLYSLTSFWCVTFDPNYHDDVHKYDKCDKCNKCDKCEKYDKYDKYEKYDKSDKYAKCGNTVAL